MDEKNGYVGRWTDTSPRSRWIGFVEYLLIDMLVWFMEDVKMRFVLGAFLVAFSTLWFYLVDNWWLGVLWVAFSTFLEHDW